METSAVAFSSPPIPSERTGAPPTGFNLAGPTAGSTVLSGPQQTASAGQLVAQGVQLSGPATENAFNVIAPAATVLGVKLQLAGDADFPGLGRVTQGTAMLAALIIPNRVIVGDVAARLAEGDVAGALAASPDLLTESTAFLTVPNPGRSLGLPGSDGRSAASVITVPLNGAAPQFGAAAPNTIPLPGGALAFNNPRGSGDGNTAAIFNAGVVVPVPGGRAAGEAIASALTRAAGRNNNPGAPATLADDALASVIGRSLSQNTQLYLGAGFAGNLNQTEDGQLSITALNTTATLDPDRVAGQFSDWLRGRSSLPGSGGDDGSFPVASYATGATIEGLGALFALRGGTLTAAPYAAGVALRTPEAVDSAIIDLAVANGLHKVDTAMLVNDVRNGANVNGSTAVSMAQTYGQVIDRALERGVEGVDAEQIRDHLSQAMNYTGPDPRETALVRLTAASILGDSEGIDQANESLQALDRGTPGGPPVAASDIPTPGRGPDETVGEHIAPQTRSAALTEDWQILDTRFDRLGGRGSATGWVSRTVEAGEPVQATAPDGTEREVRLGLVDTNDGATRHVALTTPGSAAHVDLPPEASGSREAAERHVAGAIAAGAFPDSPVTDPARDSLTAITNTPTLPGGGADGSRVDALWDRYQARNPGYDAIRAGDFLVDIYNRDGATGPERANTAHLYGQPEMEPVRILNATIFAAPGGKVDIPAGAEGADDVFTAREVAPAFAEMRERFGEAEYQRRVTATAEALHEAGWPLNFGVRDLANALDRIEAERGPPTLDPAFEATAPRYRP